MVEESMTTRVLNGRRNNTMTVPLRPFRPSRVIETELKVKSKKFRGWKFAGFQMFQLIKIFRAGWRLGWFQYFATISQFPGWHTTDAASAACFSCFLCELLHVCDVSFPQSTRKGSQVRQLIHNANCSVFFKPLTLHPWLHVHFYRSALWYTGLEAKARKLEHRYAPAPVPFHSLQQG